MNIDWNGIEKTMFEQEEPETLKLSELEIDESMLVKFLEVFEGNGSIGARVQVDEDGPSKVLRLKSGNYGPANGLGSLMKAAKNKKGEILIEGNTFKASKVTSEKSPVGYAFLWENQ